MSNPNDDDRSTAEEELPDSVWDLFATLDARAAFRQRPDPIPGDLRTAWRLSGLVLILNRARASSASLNMIHVLSWAMRSRESQQAFVRAFNGHRRPDELLVRYDPAVSTTIDLAVGFGLAGREASGAVKLSIEGQHRADELWREAEIMQSEKRFLSQLPARITKRAIDELLNWR